MASSKRKSSKQRRTQRNRAERDARRARSLRAGEATEIAEGLRTPVSSRPGDEGGSGDDGDGAVGRRKRGSGKARPKRVSPYTIPGQRAVTLSFLFALVSAATLILTPITVEREVPIDDERVTEEDLEQLEASEEESEGGSSEGDTAGDPRTVTIEEDSKLWQEESAPIAALVSFTPIAITGAALAFTKRPKRPTAWNIALLAFAAYLFFLSGGYGILALPSMVALAIGTFQTRKAESEKRIAALKAKQAAEADGEVIDVDEVDEPRGASDGDDSAVASDDRGDGVLDVDEVDETAPSDASER